MIESLEAARDLLHSAVNEGFQKYHPDDELVIMDEQTITKDYGWIFFYQGKKYLESGDWSDLVVGQGPTIVLRDGTIESLGSALPAEQAIAKYEQSRRRD